MEIVVPEEFRYLYIKSDLRPVVKVPDPVLRQRAHEVAKVGKKTQMLIDDMVRIMKKANGIGLAAPQIGILQRIVIIAPDGMRPTPLVNPVVVSSSGEFTGQEGCLSIPGLYGDVTRPSEIEVESLDRWGKPIRLRMKGMPAKVVQHEIDHLDGVLFTDKVDAKTLHWEHPDEAPVEEE
jgi:peptide deformylase